MSLFSSPDFSYYLSEMHMQKNQETVKQKVKRLFDLAGIRSFCTNFVFKNYMEASPWDWCVMLKKKTSGRLYCAGGFIKIFTWQQGGVARNIAMAFLYMKAGPSTFFSNGVDAFWDVEDKAHEETGSEKIGWPPSLRECIIGFSGVARTGDFPRLCLVLVGARSISRIYYLARAFLWLK